ncbi:unnamed protein product [Clonostachys rosea]|uniref:Amidase domain-containing protein n=1 Tax=Bionectria ochroleuca TaxID=29856 RepID=A0ABY6UT10_BIOOC|nr:unnamed protein product [Clonostachys rosea]
MLSFHHTILALGSVAIAAASKPTLITTFGDGATTYRLANATYYSTAIELANVYLDDKIGDIGPVTATVFVSNETTITAQVLSSLADSYKQVDDVWTPEFLDITIFLNDKRPLSGLRFAIKDIYHVKGVQTTGGSRVYTDMHPEADATAISVTKLLELGAIPVGKTKTSQFAYGIEPWHWQDFKYPWNPRGDGYMQIAYSSSGSGAAIVAYDWIDFALGSDTGGSVRIPAALGGSYGIRPTWGGMDLTNVLPLSHPFDTAGFFARDPQLFSKIGKLWYANSNVEVNKTYNSFPTKLLYPLDYFPLASPDAQKVVEDFIAKLESVMGMTKQDINVTEILSHSDIPAVNNKTVTEGIFLPTFTYDSWRSIGKYLVDKWSSSFPTAGFPPFDNRTRASYMSESEVTDQVYQEKLDGKAAWKAYAEKNILGPSNETCSDGIMLMHSGGNGLPSYREEYLNEQPGAGFLVVRNPPLLNPCIISPLMNAPQIDIPIGQAPYKSVISLQDEYLPVVIDLMASPGCDYMLYDLVSKLQEEGLIKTVKTGRLAF